MTGRRALGAVAWVAGAVLAWWCAAPALAGDRTLVAASDGQHAWIVVDRARASGIEHVLLHHAAAMGCDCAREAFVLPQVPEAMAAKDGALWLAMPPAAAGARRDVYSLEVARNPATSAFFSVPEGRMVIHPSLPGEGDLLGLAVLDAVPVALRSGAALEVLRPSGWAPLPDAPAATGMRLAMADGAPALVDPAGTVRIRRDAGTWGSPSFQGPGASCLGLIDGTSRPAVLMRVDGGERALAFLRPDGPPLRFASFPAPDRASAVLGVGGRVGLFLPTGEGGAAVRWIEQSDGSLGPSAILAPAPSDAGRWVLSVAVAFAALATVGGVLARRSLRLKSSSAERR